MRTLQATQSYPATAEQLVRVITSQEFLEERHRLGPVARARVVEHQLEGTRLRVRVATDEYGRTATGKVDQSRTDPAETVYDWDVTNRKCKWTWTGPHGDRIRIQGALAIEAAGNGSVLRSEFQITARAPVIGRVVERLIAGEIEKGMPEYDQLLRRFIDRAAS